MKHLLLAFTVALLMIGCSSKNEESLTVAPKIVVGKNILDTTLQDQFEKEHTIQESTTKLILALDKESAHICNDFFVTQAADYLRKNNTQFIADVSAAPSLIRSMFILPGLKEFKHKVLLLDTKEKAAPFRSGLDTQKITVVGLRKGVIEKITTISTVEELQKAIENN